jgi:hypothetical protein
MPRQGMNILYTTTNTRENENGDQKTVFGQTRPERGTGENQDPIKA